MVIGVDFDNTLVCYDGLFHRLAAERGLIPPGLPAGKNSVRDFLRRAGQEEKWIELQGDVYGPRIAGALPFPGVIDFFTRALRLEIPIHIISHKTRHPVIGPPHDLHGAALDWLRRQGFFDRPIGLPAENVHFGLTRPEKIDHIRRLGCTVFIDDLEETYLEPSFPPGVERILFAPQREPEAPPGVARMTSWRQIHEHVFKPSN
jgi:hypothetical protein